jgi:hypothetical protein
MELLATRLARVIAFLRAEELNPAGRPIAHDFMKKFVEHYSFIKFPQKADELLDSENKGVTFELGKFKDVAIDRLALFDWGMVVDTSASTEMSEEILEDMLAWGAKEYGLSNRPTLITRKAYVSELVFSSEMLLSSINPSLENVGRRIAGLVTGYGKGGFASAPYETLGFVLGFDVTQSKQQLFTPFRVERLADTAFQEKKYFSAAPLKTSDHVELISELELAFPRAGVLPLPIE